MIWPYHKGRRPFRMYNKIRPFHNDIRPFHNHIPDIRLLNMYTGYGSITTYYNIMQLHYNSIQVSHSRTGSDRVTYANYATGINSRM